MMKKTEFINYLLCIHFFVNCPYDDDRDLNLKIVTNNTHTIFAEVCMFAPILIKSHSETWI